MTKKAIFFDLDGTITDSGEGIMNCATLALEHFGLPVPDREQMRVFVGPPLDQTFIKFGVPADKTDEAIKVFRSRYTTVGKFENFPYPGVADMLQSLKSQGHRLFVATSKPEVMANEVLRHFDLDGYFEQIAGATLDGSRSHKADVITYLLGLTGDVGQTLMVGDTAFDVIGAAAHGIPTIGVSWGYGTAEDMEKAGAIAIAHSMAELVALINQ
jgi:phosphoglycolate phosphatase